jgi:hypothetical protein
LRQAAERSEAGDQEQIGKTAEKQAEETVEIARDEPARLGARRRLDRARDFGSLASFSFAA